MAATTTKSRPRAGKLSTLVAPQDFLRVIEFIDTRILVERPLELRVLNLALLAGVNCHQLGPPGTAKSLSMREIGKSIVGARTFEKPMNQGLVPDVVIGPFDIPKFAQTGVMERQLEGYAPDAHVIILDEWFRANGMMLDALLPIANTTERMAEHNGTMVKIPALVLASASNHMPDADNEQAQALVDRITLMVYVERVKSAASFKEIIVREHDRRIGDKTGTLQREQVTLEQVHEAQRQVAEIKSTPDYLDALADLRERTFAEGLDVSDRRWTELGYVCRAQAWMNGRDVLAAEDLSVAEHGLWRDKDHRPIAHKLVLPFLGRFESEAVSKRTESAEHLQEWNELRPMVEAAGIRLPDDLLRRALQNVHHIDDCKKRVDGVLAEAEKEKRDAASLRDLGNELLAAQMWFHNNKLPTDYSRQP